MSEVITLKDYDFSSFLENDEVINDDGVVGNILVLVDGEYPSVVIQWNDESITSHFHFNCKEIYFLSDLNSW